MRRINLLFIFIPVLFFTLFIIYRGLNRNSANFFGVAENQETQINLDHAVTVQKINVSEGQFVTKGALLMEVNWSALAFKLSSLSHDVSELTARDRLSQIEIRNNLNKYIALRAEKAEDIQARIRLMESENLLNQQLFENLKSLPGNESKPSSSVYETRLQSLRQELRLSLEPIDIEIAHLQQELKLSHIPAQTEIGKLKNEIELYEKEKDHLLIYAPSDGLVGSLHCRIGENIPEFNALISFYEQSPNTVIAYLHESLSLEIKVGDSLRVTSTLHPDETCMGKVSGLGHRIVEIPERLRKIPEIKTYGREVLIQIPSTNHFLQKEKVILQRLPVSAFSFLSLLERAFPKTS
ncbi:MAG TPA: efflux RND transporter periplasmic adaptor subunit [Saprospiraceae bacterium]|nr:efflux RND transporter periplasmic adaptor subunit [Saprospiraceae bacterium]